MKHWKFVIAIFLFVTVSCRESIEYKSLSESSPIFDSIYALKDAYPDDAYMIFKGVVDTLDEDFFRKESGFLFAEYQILKAEMDYKKNHSIKNVDQVRQAYSFYDSLLPDDRAMRRNKALAYQLARSCYCKAVAEEWLERRPIQQFSDYLKALWITDGLAEKRQVVAFGKKEPQYEHFTGLIYDRLAWLLYNQDAWDVAMECLERSKECFENEDDMASVASSYELMGDVMLAQDDRMESVKYYKMADSIYTSLGGNKRTYSFGGLIHKSITLSHEGETEASKQLLLQTLSQAKKEWMKRRAHFGLGYTYYDLQQYDSSLYHYERSYPLLPRQTIKSYSRIIRIANALGDSTKAAHYGELLADFYLDHMAQNGQKTRMVTMYENYKAESKYTRQKDILYFVLLILGILALVIATDTFFIQRHRIRRKKEIEHHEKIRASLENEIETTRRISNRREEKIKALESELEKANGKESVLPFSERIQLLYEKPICKRVTSVTEANVKANITYPELTLSETQLSQLVQAVDSIFPKFSARIIEQHPRLKRADVIYCCMYILGLTEAQAAALTGKTYQAVWIRSQKLHEIFDSDSDLQFILYDMLKKWG